MPVISTKAIVFSAIKYSDSSLIVKCFTEEEGLKSYLLRGVLSSKKRKLKSAYFQPFTQLLITASHNTKGNLNTIKEAQVLYPYKTIYSAVVKQSIVLFLSEVMSSIIQEEEENKQLYTYIETALVWLDTNEPIANFHVIFLMNLTSYLGFYPDTAHIEKPYFNLLEGIFTDFTDYKNTIDTQNLTLFKKVLGINFDNSKLISFSKNERQIILKIILNYFELHLNGFKQPKSLSVLEAVFS